MVGMEETFIKERPAKTASEQAVHHADGRGRVRPAWKPSTWMTPPPFWPDSPAGPWGPSSRRGSPRDGAITTASRSTVRKGSVYFDLENMNRLEYYNADDPGDVPGFRSIQVNEGCHPYIDHWWPPGHGIGYQNTFVNQYADFLQAIAEDTAPTPGFEVGLENQKVLEAVTRSIAEQRWVAIP